MTTTPTPSPGAAAANSPRERLPNRRRSETVKATMSGQNVYFTISRFADGRIAEVFVNVNKAGSAFNGLMDALAITISIGLQHGVPLGTITAALGNIAFEPMGEVVGNPSVERANSIVDYLAKALQAEQDTPSSLPPAVKG